MPTNSVSRPPEDASWTAISTETSTPSQIAKSTLSFIAGFFVSAALIHLLVGDPIKLYAAERSEKFALLAQSSRPFNTLFLGSSHVNQEFDPRVFDQALQSSKPSVHSFNLGVDGGSQVEQRAMALELLRQTARGSAPRPCLVMLEATAGPTFSEVFISHPRQINILDVPSLRIVLKFHPYGWTPAYWTHRASISALAVLYHEVNLGMLSNLIFRPPLNAAMMEEESKNDQRGIRFEPPTRESKLDVDKFFAARKYPPDAVPRTLNEGYLPEMEDLHQAPYGRQIQWVWVTIPTLDDLQRYYVTQSPQKTSFGGVPVLDLARPDLYPELYDPSMWRDDQHMNQKGATRFSQILASLIVHRWPGNELPGCGV